MRLWTEYWDSHWAISRLIDLVISQSPNCQITKSPNGGTMQDLIERLSKAGELTKQLMVRL
jgi:hypothetical protein